MESLIFTTFNIFDKLTSFFSKESVSSNIKSFDITLPTNVLHRTELICKYISTEKNYDFEIENFLMLLYLDFIKTSVKNYNPKKIYDQLTTKYYQKRSMLLTINNENFEVETTNVTLTSLEISIAYDDYIKGQLILDELYDLYKIRISFNRLLESLWMGFIESYKRGENKRAYSSIVKLLKETID